jgi:hypothetical protein
MALTTNNYGNITTYSGTLVEVASGAFKGKPAKNIIAVYHDGSHHIAIVGS